jgi:hypothetical protein
MGARDDRDETDGRPTRAIAAPKRVTAQSVGAMSAPRSASR